QRLYWANEGCARGAVHHLRVLCYHLQHRSLCSAEGLAHGRELLADFVARGLTPQEARRNNREHVAAGNRAWSITARPGNVGAYEHPIVWGMTAADVVAGGPANYVVNTRKWAATTHSDMAQQAIDQQ